ncbi:6487_t:CDS:10 [Gigaspora margarita]|uniref:6487_t:CDS:1 n=1 Tax=Gigaspora margarita TaxID=4874 RepID=A0ABN7VIW4_GIGMA|nr:6487_t:CDS:10 [Gigaspora margarita]
MVKIFGKELEKEQEQQLKYLVLILLLGAGFYFFVYLPEQQKKQLEMEIQSDINLLQNLQSAEYTDDYLATDKDKYDSKVAEQGIEKSKQQKKAKANAYSDPSRGKPDESKKDNNALFFGTEGTGKTSIVRKLTYETDCYPMIEVKGSTLSPNKLDSDIGIAPLEKFIFTICDIEHTLEDDYNFKREKNGEVRFILFVDEADLVSRESRYFDPIKLAFLKECMEQRAVYRPGRLSNPLDFSWTLGDFVRYSRKAGITNQFPSHWIENPVLNKEDNKFINNYETQKILKEEKEFDDKGGEVIKKKDTGQLQHFDGKFVSPKPPKIEDIVEKTIAKVDETLAIRLEEKKYLQEEETLLGTIAGVCAAPFTGGASLGVVAACGGLGFVGGKVAESAFDGGGDDNSTQQLLEQQKLQNEQFNTMMKQNREELEKIRKEREKKEKKIKDNQKELDILKSKEQEELTTYLHKKYFQNIQVG